MASQVTNYKCPACSGPLHFTGGKLQCDYCGSTFTVEDIEARMAEADSQAAKAFAERPQESGQWDASQMGSDWGAEAENLRVYNCPSCGAELLCDAATAATSCPYCGNHAIVPGQFAGALKPDLVLPFQLEKDAAVKALKRHYQGKAFLPKSFKDENHVQEIKGVYVPFWLFDGMAQAAAEYNATQVSVHQEGDYEVTTTRHFQIRRSGDVSFEKVPVDASKRMPDDLMDSIEPYDYKDLRPFTTACLPGFLADRYDVSVQDCSARADERCRNSALAMLRDTVQGYDTCVPTSENVRLHRGRVRYALMPVWLLSTQWKGKNFLFAMNGQTGKLVGDLPMSWKKFWITFGAIAVGLSAVITVIANLL